jgi:hypothetical protein
MPTLRQPTYDEDFFAWTQDQASALRGLPAATIGNRVDVVHIAEEIEDLGKRDIREVESYVRQLLTHLLKLAALPDARERPHWIAEAEEFQARAAETFRPSMAQLVDLDRAWNLARRAASSVASEMGGTPLAAAGKCPFDLAALVATDFDVRGAIARIAAG